MKNYSITPGKDVSLEVTDSSSDLEVVLHSLIDEIYHRRDFLEESQAYLDAAPLGSEFELESDQEFPGIQQLRDMSRNNYAKLIVSATTDRLNIQGFRTSQGSDEFGDREALRIFQEDNMMSSSQEAHTLACSFRSSYLYVDPIAKRQHVVAPTNAAVIADVSGEPAAAVVIMRDKLREFDIMSLFVRDIDMETGEATGPAMMFVATRELARNYSGELRRTSEEMTLTRSDREMPFSRHNLFTDWVWWKENKALPIERIPVTPMINKDGKSEFEDYTHTIDRTNHMIYQRVNIATSQAFKQKAVIGTLPSIDPDTKEEIDYSEMFASGPGRLWTLPEGTQFWESEPTTFADILEAVRSDVKDLASQTYTPMSYFSDSANNSAEGASLQRENYISKIEDRRQRFAGAWNRHNSIVFEIRGDKERSKIENMDVIWTSAQVYSITDSAAAYASLTTAGMPKTTSMREALGWSPSQIKRAKDEMMEDAMAQALAEAINQNTPLGKSSASTRVEPVGQTAQTQEAAKSNRQPDKGIDNKLKAKNASGNGDK